MKYDLLPLFSFPLIIFDTDLHKTESALRLRNHPSFERAVDDDCWSTCENNILLNEEYKELKNQIDTCFLFYKKECLKIKDDFDMVASWGIKHRRGDYTTNHMHVNAVISGILYLNVDENSGDLHFSNVSSGPFFNRISYNCERENILTAMEWRNTPKNGELYLFPSTLPHFVKPSKSDIERTLVAFNYFPRRYSSDSNVASLKFNLSKS